MCDTDGHKIQVAETCKGGGAMSERTEFITGLRELADYLENNPDVPIPYQPYFAVCVTNYVEPEKTKDAIQSVARCPGPWRKELGESLLTLTKDFHGVKYGVICDRSHVCKMVEPAKPAVWDCEPLLSAKEFEELTA